jgi:hypothetical protein
LNNGATVGDTITTISFYVSSVLNAIPATAGSVSASYLAGGAARSNWGAGGVLQVVYATTTTQVASTVSTFADTGLTATITPSSTSSKILVLVTQSCKKSGANASNNMHIKAFRNSTDLGYIGYGILFTNTANENYVTTSANLLDSPATTSAVTYKTQFSSASNTATVYVQPDNLAPSFITLMEISA